MERRLLLLTEFFLPDHGGIQHALGTILESVGPAVTVVTKPQPGQAEFDRQQPYQVIRRSLFSGRGWPSWAWLIPWLWRQRGHYRLTVFGHYSAAVTAAWILSYCGYRYAILVHGQDILSEQRRPGRRFYISSTLRRAQFIGVNSNFTGREVHRHSIPWSRIIRTHPAVNKIIINHSLTPKVTGRVITICRLVPRKNVINVIRAIKLIASDYPNLGYDLIGTGPQLAVIKNVIKELALESHVNIHGQVTDQQKYQLLSTATVAVMVPLVLAQGSDVEGLGIFFLEAAAYGLPIVASRTGGIPDVVINNKTGLLVSPDSVEEIAAAIKKLLANRQLAQQYGRAGQDLIIGEFSAQVRNQRFNLAWQPLAIEPKPLVSIIIPAYQSAATIGRTLTDIYSQTWPNLEVIIVDDGSTDQLEQALATWRTRLRIIRQPNRGAAAARNTGAAQARGEFLLFIDADTSLEPDMLTTMVAVLVTHPDAAFAYSNFKFGPKGFHLFEYSPDKLRQRNYIHTSSLIRRGLFTGFDQTLKKFQDWDLWLTLAARQQPGIWIPRQLFRVQQRALKSSRSVNQISSYWLPRLVYRLPLIGRGLGNSTIAKYRQAEEIIRHKHRL